MKQREHLLSSRKATMTLVGVACVLFLAALGIVFHEAGGVTTTAVGAIAGLIATYVTGSSAIEFRHGDQSRFEQIEATQNINQRTEFVRHPKEEDYSIEEPDANEPVVS